MVVEILIDGKVQLVDSQWMPEHAQREAGRRADTPDHPENIAGRTVQADRIRRECLRTESILRQEEVHSAESRIDPE